MKLFLACYPRSGSHWLAYCINTLAGLGGAEFERTDWCRPGSVEGDVAHTHCHNDDFWGAWDPDEDGLIVLVRDYKEAMTRHLRSKNIKPQDLEPYRAEATGTCARKDGYDADYVGVLATYDRTDDARRLLVYYEDLMTQPEVEVARTLEFLSRFGVEHRDLDEFMADIDAHREKSLGHYDRKGSHTKGIDLTHHQRSLPPGLADDLDRWMADSHEDLFARYLSRYGDAPSS